jgi:hypothetical protein
MIKGSRFCKAVMMEHCFCHLAPHLSGPLVELRLTATLFFPMLGREGIRISLKRGSISCIIILACWEPESDTVPQVSLHTLANYILNEGKLSVVIVPAFLLSLSNNVLRET